MYKCKECGAEYENKPDYCECGNDEFEMEELTISNNGNAEQIIEKKPQPILPIVNKDGIVIIPALLILSKFILDTPQTLYHYK